MAKSKNVVSKKVVAANPAQSLGATQAASQAITPAPAVPASEPVQAEAVAPTPVSAPVPATDKRARRGRAADSQADDPRAKWTRRLGRWAGKVEVAGLDPRALMAEYLDKA